MMRLVADMTASETKPSAVMASDTLDGAGRHPIGGSVPTARGASGSERFLGSAAVTSSSSKEPTPAQFYARRETADPLKEAS
jgi:hypothetical protein